MYCFGDAISKVCLSIYLSTLRKLYILPLQAISVYLLITTFLPFLIPPFAFILPFYFPFLVLFFHMSFLFIFHLFVPRDLKWYRLILPPFPPGGGNIFQYMYKCDQSCAVPFWGKIHCIFAALQFLYSEVARYFYKNFHIM
jgi:hypothetical protein